MNQIAATPTNDEVETTPIDTGKNVMVTRFGELAFDPEKIITFDQGLYGFEHRRQFLLSQVPAWPDLFKLLQSMDDPNLSLIVLPFDNGNGPIDPADFTQACSGLGYDPASTTVIGIVTMREEADNQVFTVNLKAPILIDSQHRKGHQHVFASEKYPLRHLLQPGQAEG